MFVTIDLVLLTLNIIIGEALGASEAVLVPNKDNPHTITGVRIVQFGPNYGVIVPISHRSNKF